MSVVFLSYQLQIFQFQLNLTVIVYKKKIKKLEYDVIVSMVTSFCNEKSKQIYNSIL